MPELTGMILAFIGMLFFGVGDSLFQLPARRYTERVILFYQYLFIAILAIGLLLLLDTNVLNLDFRATLLLPMVAGIFEVLGIMFFIKSIKKEGVGLSIAIASSYPLITFTYAFLFFHENLSIIQILSIFTIISGVFLMSLNKFGVGILRLNKNLKFAFLAFLSWGALTVTLKYSSFYYEPMDTTIIMSIVAFIVILIYQILFGNMRGLKMDKKYIAIISVIASLLFFAIFFMNSAFQKTETSLVSAIISSSAMLTALIGYFFYKERFHKHQYIGILMVLTALFSLNYFG